MTTATLTPQAADVATHPGATFFLQTLERLGWRTDEPRTLVVGCGRGHEAVYLQQQLGGRVDAIDVLIESSDTYAGVPEVHFQEASVQELPFDDGSFDVVFYHHVIEHVPDPPDSLTEIARVLRPGGVLFVGTPNRHRAISAVGAHRQHDWESTWQNKLRENLQDWRARLTGRFRNELGAHAGFSRGELDRLLARHFEVRHWLTRDYLRAKYAGHRLEPLIRLATLRPFRWFMAPGIYVLCRPRAERTAETVAEVHLS